MRQLALVFGGLLVCSGNALAEEKVLTFQMMDLYTANVGGNEHLIGVALDHNGHMAQRDHSVTYLSDGKLAGKCTYVFDDGSTVTSEFVISREGDDYSGNYTVVSGTGSLSGGRGQGRLVTLKGREGASSSSGVYQVKLVVDTP